MPNLSSLQSNSPLTDIGYARYVSVDLEILSPPSWLWMYLNKYGERRSLGGRYWRVWLGIDHKNDS